MKVLTLKQFAVEVRNKIQAGWAKDSFAKTKHSKCTSVESDNAARFCLLGAVSRVRFENVSTDNSNSVSKISEDFKKLLIEQPEVRESLGIALFNDSETTTKKTVLNLLDRVIGTL